MYSRNKLAISLFALSLSTTTAFAGTPGVWTSGHGDIGIAYEDGWDLHIHAEGALIDGVEQDDVEYEPADVIIQVPAFSQINRPAGAAWAPVGVPGGAPFWLIPQTETVGVPFVGFGTEEIPAGDFLGDAINLTLTGVTSPSGTGLFSTYQTDTFGSPTFFMSNSDGVGAGDLLPLTADGHLHANIAFSEPGLWAITFEASGVHTIDGPVSGDGTYYFNVLPEPASASLLIAAGAVLFLRRSRGTIGRA